jgi:hypothetical protein
MWLLPTVIGRMRAPVARGGPQTDADARAAGEAPDGPHMGHRVEHAAVLHEAGTQSVISTSPPA